MPLLDLTIVPFLWSEEPDSSIIDEVDEIAGDPEGDERLRETRVLLPVGELDVTAHEPVTSSSNNGYDLISQTSAIRVMEGRKGHYMGTMRNPVNGGLAYAPGRSTFAVLDHWVIAHELGHNMNLPHAPCGGGGASDDYPYAGGRIGAWGWSPFRGELIDPSYKDLMGCVGRRWWVSDFHFTKALYFRASDADHEGLPYIDLTQGSLLLWGGLHEDDSLFLNPAFVVDAPPALPATGGAHRLVGRDDDEAELFSVSFAMPAMADAEGGPTSFAFAIPVSADWEGSLSSITLSGPEGSVTLDKNSNRAMVVLFNRRTGQVRGILDDLPRTVLTRADAVGLLSPGSGLELRFSRGVPGKDAWRWGRVVRR